MAKEASCFRKVGTSNSDAQIAALEKELLELINQTGIGPQGLGGAATGASLAMGLSLPTLPLRAIARKRGIAVGLVTQSWRGWAADLAKGAVIEGVLAAGAGAAVVAVTRRYPRSWWLPASAGSVVFVGALAALAPVVLDPMFNDFTPLQPKHPELVREDLLASIAYAANLVVQERVYPVDA